MKRIAKLLDHLLPDHRQDAPKPASKTDYERERRRHLLAALGGVRGLR